MTLTIIELKKAADPTAGMKEMVKGDIYPAAEKVEKLLDPVQMDLAGFGDVKKETEKI